MIEVRLFATLTLRSAGARGHFQREWHPGLTVREIVEAEGLQPADIRIIMVNGVHGTLESELEDGDRLGLFPPVGGG